MSTMGEFAGAGTQVLLVATASHENGSTLPPLPAALTTLDDLADVFTQQCGVEPGRISRMVDPANPIVLANEIKNVASQAGDVFLLWYAGHGLLSNDSELHLATHATVDVTRGLAAYQALPFAQVHELLREHCSARTVVLVVDACHAGRAAHRGFGLGRGGGRRFLLASASRDEHAIAPPGARHTAFTGALMDLLRDGDPYGGPDLTLDRIARVLTRILPERGYPAPQWWAAHDAGDLIVATNPAYRPPDMPRRPGGDDGQDEVAGAVCPYPGLAAFGPQDARFFHGRDDLAADLLKLVATRSSEGPLLVVGSSGSGKSSLVQAGLQPALARGDIGDGASAHWPQILLTPGSDPLDALAQRLAGPAGTDPAALTRAWRADPTSFGEAIRGIFGITAVPDWPAERARVVLVVDQFEELFTQCDDPEEREHFVAALASACTADGPNGPTAIVILVLRADFLDAVTAYPLLASALSRGPLVVGPMNRDEVRQAIRAPASTAGLALEPGLVDVLLADLGAGRDRGHDPGALPMLAHALLETWLRRDHRVLTVAGYHATGGVDSAISHRAESVYAELDEAGQAAAQAMLVRLVHARDYTRRRSTKAALLSATEDQSRAADVLDRLAAARLLTIGQDSVEIAHEALLRGWPRLRDWLDADRDLHVLSQEIETDAERWDQARRAEAARARSWWRWWSSGSASADMLYRGGRLAAVRERLAGRRLADSLSAAFLRASGAQQRRTARFRLGIVATIVASLAVASSAAFAWDQRQAAIDNERIAVALQKQAITRKLLSQAELIRNTDPRAALQLAVAAHRITPMNEGITNIINTFIATGYAGSFTIHKDGVSRVVFAPNGRTLAAVDKKRAGVILWDMADMADGKAPPQPASPVPIVTEAVNDVVFAPNSSTLATISYDGAVTLWDVANPKEPQRLGLLTDHQAPVYEAVFAPNSSMLVTISYDGAVTLWNIADRRAPQRIGQPLTGQRAPVFAPDSRTLATTDEDGVVTLWDVADRRAPQRIGQLLTGHQTPVDNVVFAPDSRTLATTDENGVVTLWDVADRRVPRHIGQPLTGHQARVFAPDSRTLVTTDEDGMMTLWDVADRRAPQRIGQPLTGHQTPVDNVVFAPDSRTLATTDENGMMTLWDVADREAPQRIGQPLTIQNVSTRVFTPAVVFTSSHTLATADEDGVVTLWDIADRQALQPLGQPLTGHQGPVSTVAFAPDNRTLVTVARNEYVEDPRVEDQKVILWDIADPKAPQPLGQPLTGHQGPVSAVTYAPDSRTLATGGDDGQTILWNVTDPKAPKPLGQPLTGHQGPVSAVTYAPDGHTMVTAGDEDGKVILWNVTDPKTPQPLGQPLTVHEDGVASEMVFAPDSRTLVTASNYGRVILWDVTDPRAPQRLGPLTGYQGPVSAVAFAPDGHTLVTVDDEDGKVISWNVTDPKAPKLLGPLTGQQGPVSAVAFAPDGHTLVTADEDGRVILWDVTDPKAPQPLGQPINRGIAGMVFAPDSRKLVTADFGGTVILWDLVRLNDIRTTAIARACRAAGAGLSREDWAIYVGDMKHLETCPT
jgi:WD40 repeat protein